MIARIAIATAWALISSASAQTPCAGSVRPSLDTQGLTAVVATTGFWLRRCPNPAGTAPSNCFQQVECVDQVPLESDGTNLNFWSDRRCRVFQDNCQDSTGNCLVLNTCPTDTNAPVDTNTRPPTPAPIDTDTRPPTSAPTRPCQNSVRPVPHQTTGFRPVVVDTAPGFWLRRCLDGQDCYQRVPCNGPNDAAVVATLNFFNDGNCRMFFDDCQGVDPATGVGKCLLLPPCAATSAPTDRVSLAPTNAGDTRAPSNAPPTSAPTRPCLNSVRPVPQQVTGFRPIVTTIERGFWLRRCPNGQDCYERLPCNDPTSTSMVDASLNYFGDDHCRVFYSCQGQDSTGVGLCLLLRPCDTLSDTHAPTPIDTRPPTAAPTRPTSAPTTPCQNTVRPVISTTGFRVTMTDLQGWWLRRCSASANCYERVECDGRLSPTNVVASLNYFGDAFCRTIEDGCDNSNDPTNVGCLQLVSCTGNTASPTPLIDTRAPTAAPTAPCDRAIRPMFSHVGLQIDIITQGRGYWLRPCPSFQGCYEPVECDASWTSSTAPAGAYVGNWFGDRECRQFRQDCQIGADGVAHCFDYRPCNSPTDSPTMAPTLSPTQSPTVSPTRPPTSVFTRPPTTPPRPCGDLTLRPYWSYTGLRVTATDSIGYWLRPCPDTRNCYEPVQCDGSWTAETMPLGAYDGNWFGDRRCRAFTQGCQSGIAVDAVGVPFFRQCFAYDFCNARPTLPPTQSPTRPVFTLPPITVVTRPPISIATRPPTTQPPTSTPEPCINAVRPLWSTAGISLRVTTGEGHWLKPCPNTPGCYTTERCSGSWTSSTAPAGAYDGNFFGDRRCRVIQGACQSDLDGDVGTGVATGAATCLRYISCSVVVTGTAATASATINVDDSTRVTSAPTTA